MPTRSLRSLFAVLAGCALAGIAHADLTVYDDALENGFQDYSYGGGVNFTMTAPVHGGTHSIVIDGNAFNAISFFHEPGLLSTSDYPVLSLWIHGGTQGGQQFEVFIQDDAGIVAEGSLNAFLVPGGPAPNTWQHVSLDLTQPPFSLSGSYRRIDIQSNASGEQPSAYFDDIALVPPAGNTPDEIFASGFEISVTTPVLAIDHDVAVNGLVSDRFTWRDRAGEPRVAALAHNDGQVGPGGTRGGELVQFKYETAGGTRTVNSSGSGASGFGYPVSHRNEGTDGLPGDDSPLGHGFTGTFERVFEGRHHAIFRFHGHYPQYSRTDAAPPNTLYNVPVTIDWMVATGRNDPVWAITWNLSSAPSGALNNDSRAPYGELLFDGSASEGAHSVIAGVEWGDRYKFRTTSSPATFNSSWTWTGANTIPYVALWTTAVDATMGIVQTQSISQHDAGGYWGVDRWNTTSAAGPACTESGYTMPCDYNWPYQSINYSLDAGNPGSPTNNTRLAWGADFGFLGDPAFPIHGSHYYGGPLGNATAVGWPYQSYSTWIVLGLHSTDVVGSTVSQTEALQAVSLSTTAGSVVTSGPAGVLRPDIAAYSPAGYDPIYSALRFTAAAGGSLRANIAVGSGTVVNPLLIVGGVDASPGALSLNGAPLTADVDYFASVRADTNEVWITLNRSLTGATNAIVLTP